MGIVLQLFGGFRLAGEDGKSASLPDRARALLAYLAVASSPVPRQILAELLSEEGNQQEQRTALRQALYLARKATADAAVLSLEADLALNDSLVTADVRIFQRLIARGDHHSLLEAIELYRAPFLYGERSPSTAFEEWLSARRSEFLQQALEALLKLSRSDAASGHHSSALAHARRALALDPLREDFHREAMRSLAAMGQRCDALRQYEVMRETLAEELDLVPEDETEALREEIARGVDRDMSRRTAADPPTHPEVLDGSETADQQDTPARHHPASTLTPRAALEGERKQATVLFSDIKGSFELVADRDPEDARTVLDIVVERMIDAVHCYEGTVIGVMGGRVMALFGAPIAREDHAVRACYAALRMQEAVAHYSDAVGQSQRVPVTIRVGISSGEIVICGNRNGPHMSYTVVGRTVHLAAHMEQMAKPRSILTTADTFRLAEAYIAVNSLGPTPVKGLADLIQIYEVTGAGAARTRLQAAASRGLTCFVGRDIELEQLRRAQQLARQQRGQVVAILGEAGVGKSRLLHEFIHSCDKANWLVLESNSASYGRATPYLPVIELLRHYFNINRHDSRQSIREKVSNKVRSLDPALQDTIPPVLDLLDALEGEHPFRSLDPFQHRQFTYQAVTRIVLSENRMQPVVIIFEDLHWYDPLTLGLLNELVVTAQNARVLLVVSYRGDFTDEWTNLPNYHKIRLDPLESEELAELFQALLGYDPSLLVIKGSLAQRASGNPFFVEEIVRALVEAGVLQGERRSYRLARHLPSIEVPRTVQAVLAARIDALPDNEKRLLQEAAVIGHDVPFALLQAICEATEDELRGLLHKLQSGEFLYPTQLFPDLQYTFRHALTHDVAYSGVLRERRREIHAHVMTAMERLYADRLEEQVERLAHHAVHGELQEKAVHYLRQAGGRAAARSALPDARAWFEQALDVLKALPENQATLEQAFETRLELRPVLRQLAEVSEMRTHLREAEVLAERLKDDRRRGLVCGFMTTVLCTLDELDEAVLTGTRAVEIARRLGDLRLSVVTTSCLEETYYYRGEYDHVIEIATENLAALPSEWAQEYFGLAVPASIFGRAWLIISLAELGRFCEAAKYEAEAIRLAEPTQHEFTICWADFAASILHLLKGDWANARAVIERLIVTTRNVAMLLPWAVASSAWALAQIGAPNEALDRVRDGEQLLEHQAARGIVGHRGWGYNALGRACLLLGRLDDARRFCDRSFESSRRQPGLAAHTLRLLGDITTRQYNFDAENGAAYYREALRLAERHGMRPLVAHCHRGLGALYHRIGKTDDARENLSSARAMYREMDMGFWLEETKADWTSAS